MNIKDIRLYNHSSRKCVGLIQGINVKRTSKKELQEQLAKTVNKRDPISEMLYNVQWEQTALSTTENLKNVCSCSIMRSAFGKKFARYSY